MEQVTNEDLHKIIISAVNEFFPVEKRNAVKVVDLGCFEGGYTVDFAKNGYLATGIEVRTANYEKCLEAKAKSGLSNLSFIKDDARNLADKGTFDIVFCSGLLYHFDKPWEYLQALGKMTKKLLMLNTHYAEEVSPLYDMSPLVKKIYKRLFPGKVKQVDYWLSGLAKNEGKKGRWYHEFDEGETRENMEKSRKASIGNTRSFWLEKKDLIASIKEAGFTRVYEPFDILNESKFNAYRMLHDRSIFIGVKE